MNVWVKVGNSQEAMISCDSRDNIYKLKEKIKINLSPLFDHVSVVHIIIRDNNGNILEPDLKLSDLTIGDSKNNSFLVEEPPAPVAQVLLELIRSDFYLKAHQYPSVDSFLNKYVVCNFPDLLQDELSIYTSFETSRTSSNLFNDHTVKSSPYENSENGIQINRVRRSNLLGSPDFIPIKKLTIGNDTLKNILEHKFFNDNKVRLEEFIAKQSTILNQFRNFFCNYRKDTRQNINELVVFQPLFMLYLNGIIQDLQLSFIAQNVNNENLQRNIKVFLNGKLEERTLSGHSDVGIKLPAPMFDIIEFVLSLVELKPPFCSLHRSGSIAQKDQQYAELITLDHMKTLYCENSNDNDITVFSSVGLTDMFKFSIMIKYPEIDFCCATSSVISSNEYVVNLLMLFLNYSDPDIKSLVLKCSGVEIPVTDEDGNIISNNSNGFTNNRSSMTTRSHSKAIIKSSDNKENSNVKHRALNMTDEYEDYSLELKYLNEMDHKRQPLGTLTASYLNKLLKTNN